MKEINKLIRIGAFAIAAVLMMLIYPYSAGHSDAAEYAVIENQWHGRYTQNVRFKIKGYNGYGICGYDVRHAASKGTKGLVTDVTDKSVIKLVYYVLFKQQGEELSAEELSRTHIFVSYKLNGMKSLTASNKKKVNTAVQWAQKYTSKTMPPEYEQFKVYQWIPQGALSNRQTVVFFSYVTPGRLTVVKKPKNSKTLNTGEYSMKGAEYTVYGSDRKTVKGKLKVTGNSGKTNTVYLAPGKYYLRETHIPADSGYTVNRKWIAVDIKSGKLTTYKLSGDEREIHKPSKAFVRKTVENGNISAEDSFTFELVNVRDSTVRYTLKTGNGKSESDRIEILAGTYKVSEKTSKGYQSVTEPFKFRVRPGETFEIKWTNRKIDKGCLTVSKKNLDGESAKGFSFRIEGKLLRRMSGKYVYCMNMSDSKALERAGLAEDCLEYDRSVYREDGWKINEEDLKLLNEAAEAGQSGEYELHFKNNLEAADGSVFPLEVISHVRLLPMLCNRGKDIGKVTDEKAPESCMEEPIEGVKLKYISSFDYAAAAVPYLDKNTGEEYSVITIGSNDGGISGIPYGRYTVTEIMTEEQKLRYHDEDGKEVLYEGNRYTVEISKTRDITEESSSADYAFVFENVPRTARVKLQKTTDYGSAEGIQFTLRSEGNTSEGIPFEEEYITDEEGQLDFGELYAGTYILEESGFDDTVYINRYRLDGKAVPAVRFDITGNEPGLMWIGEKEGIPGIYPASDNEETAEFLNSKLRKLYFSKIDSGTGLFLKGAVFELRDDQGKVVLKFRTCRDEEGKASADVIEASKTVSCSASAEEPEAEGETPDHVNYEYIEISGLEEGKGYILREAAAPGGYLPCDDIDFEFKDGMKLAVKNSVPVIETVASAPGKMGLADKELHITDKVSYENLIPGRTYTVRGRLMYGGGEFVSEEKSAVRVNEKPVEASVEFTPEASFGEITVDFEFDGSDTGGRSIVVFEELYYDGNLIIAHNDPNNSDQTVIIPSLNTSAALHGRRVYDIVKYENIVPGTRYVVKGWLVDTESGSKISGSEGQKEFYASGGDGSGTLKVKLPVDIHRLAGTKVTAFEELYEIRDEVDSDTGIPSEEEEILIAEHKDINSSAQTVDIPSPSEGPPKTGDSAYFTIWFLTILTSMALAACILRIRHRGHIRRQYRD